MPSNGYETIGGPMFEMYFRNVLMLLLCSREGLRPRVADVPPVLQSQDYRRRSISRVMDEGKAGWDRLTRTSSGCSPSARS